SGLQLFDVLRPVAELVEELNTFDPAVVIGYATSLEILAGERRGGRLRIEPALVGSVAEVLTQKAREEIGETFGCPVVDEYSTSEFGPITFDCTHGWLHVNSDWVILEPVESDHSPTPAGRPSHSTLLTNLANRVQPLIRYELGDSVLVSEDGCPCGSPFLAIRVDGRRDDTLRFPGPDGTTVPISPRALGTVLESVGAVEHYQALQTGPARLKVRLSFSEDMDPSSGREIAERALAGFFEKNRCSEVELIFDTEPPHRDPETGKYRLIWDARRN
ncbi:MAG TPA: phenylacetate--CoA ligase family protein, partial [Actinomycetota bacterium]|nr:phenylacetate--CoA ligase family protein [Actinomycetota bacterium]